MSKKTKAGDKVIPPKTKAGEEPPLKDQNPEGGNTEAGNPSLNDNEEEEEEEEEEEDEDHGKGKDKPGKKTKAPVKPISEDDAKLQAHGLTKGQMKDIHRAQIEKRVVMMDANNADNIKDKWFKTDFEDHQIPQHESKLMHVAQEARSFHATNGTKLSNSFVQKYSIAVYERMAKRNAFKGYATHILHDGRND